MNENSPLRLDRVARIYHQGGRDLVVFREISFGLAEGEIVALVGQSGAGKSSLLHIAGLLETPTAGDVLIDGEAVSRLPERRRTELRRKSLGFVYQAHHLLPEFNAEENVAMPLRIAGVSRKAAAEEARRLLSLVGLAERMTHRPAQLSGGEQQRVAIARALANSPRVLLADEPTGNLDPRTADGVFDMLIELVRGERLTALVATHNHELTRKMDRTLILDQGRIVERGLAETVDGVRVTGS
ncbi:MAG TPA: ABC transporter ATP-binding protein [Micropepsaceae bacterium]|nr:ABC transporter ATP-binding protein [Micropepsaceae bacterium]